MPEARFLNSRYQRAGMLFEKYPAAHFKSHIFSQSQYFFSENEIMIFIDKPRILIFKN